MSHILLLEDDRELADSIRRPLQARGYSVSVASNARAALSMANRRSPDLILLDLAVRNRDAYHVINGVRLYPELSNTPMVAMTAWEKLREKKKNMRAGIRYFLEKPVDTDDLISLVSSVLSRGPAR